MTTDHIDRYIVDLWRRNYRTTTIRQIDMALHGWERWLNSRRTPLDRATERDVHEWIASRGRNGQPLSPRSRYSSISILHNFYAWAELNDPTQRMRRPKLPRLLPRPIRRDDLEHALAQASPTMRAWLALMGFGGLRCMEVAGLLAQDVTVDSIRVTGKGGHERVVPTHPRIAAALAALDLPQRGRLWRRSPQYVSTAVSAHLRACGLSDTAHALRHYYGTAVYRVSRDLRLTQTLMGHASPVTTAGYAAAAMEHAAEIVAAI